MTKWLLALCLAWAAPAVAGVRIETKVTADSDRPAVDTVVKFQGDNFRVDRLDPTGTFMNGTIFHDDRMMILDGRSKTYHEMTLEQLKSQMAAFEAAEQQMSPEMRKRIQDQMTSAAAYSFKRTSGGDKIAGFACENYQILKDGKENGTACLVPWKSSGVLHKEDLAPMKKFIDQVKSISKLSPGDVEISRFDEWPGWPALMRAPDGHERSRLVKVTRTDIPAKEFDPPADYTAQKLPPMPVH